MKENIPRKLELFIPGEKKAAATLMILGSQSDAFREKSHDSLRAAALHAKKGEMNFEYLQMAEVDQVSALIDSWTFDDECTEENKKKFLTNAPAIRNQINVFAADDGNFLAKK